MRQITANSALQELEAHFGLGDAQQLDLLRIVWPSGTVQEITGVTPNQILTVTEPRMPILSSAIRSVDGAVVVTVTADPEQHVVVYSSGDLLEWQEEGEFIGSGDAIELSPEAASRFYRAEAR